MLKKPTAPGSSGQAWFNRVDFSHQQCVLCHGWRVDLRWLPHLGATTTSLHAVALPPQAPDPYQLVRARVTQGLEAVCSVYVSFL